MAFECQESFHLVPSNSIIVSSLSSDLSCVLRPNFPQKTLKKQTLPNPKEEDNGGGGGDSGSNGRRLITDLPAALVSEIFHCLDAKDLGIVACVSTLLNNLATNHLGWKKFYFERWGPPSSPSPDSGKSWNELFVERQLKSKCFMGRYTMDILHGVCGNTEVKAVRAVFLLKTSKLIFTSGYDSIVRMWGMEDGILIAGSRPLGCTIRAIVADDDMLLAGGDGFIQGWRAIEGNPHCFDLTGNNELRIRGHEGPITCLGLDSQRIFSGSWDMSIRIWSRTSLKCLKKLMHVDWVWSLAPCGSTVASTAGSHAYVWDIESGELVDLVRNAHMGKATSVARSFLGDLLFTGGQDGAIHMFEVRSSTSVDGIRMIATWKPHTDHVNSLAFEFPWLVSASSDGRLALINVRNFLQCSRAKKSVLCAVEPPQRMLHGFGKDLYSIAVGADRIICGGEEGVVRVWNFSQALEAAKRAQNLRSIRLENRMRRRKAQIELNAKSGRPDQSLASPKKTQMSGSRNGIWKGKQRDRKN
ncbi:uncharacterized protein A4U43_C05F290 [Asparagus officinalis]|uniref:F-box domain-containing protein n=1 Tax=Asparagus officinalis TaxID=4686 RepID=A0A5P1ETS1_ASPOF|nr:F-box/WD-40 repeat-containing protein At5g21040 [Asparagus officinalis]ONK67460.1 uncharacterized protein A4U43_C05F290 [Asparagus officinalis]